MLLNDHEPRLVTVEEAIQAGKFIGIIGGLSNENYHKAPGLSNSALKEFAKTPAHYQAYLRSEKEPTTAQTIGTFFHMRTLERDLFDKTVVRVENRVKKENKEIIAEAEALKKHVLIGTEYEKVCRMSDAILEDPDAQALLQRGKPEQSIFWTDPETGTLLKCRPDYLRDEGVIVDLKHFNDLDDESLMKQIHRMKYHWQSAFYLAGVGHHLNQKLNLFAHIFVRDADPFLVRVIILNDASLEKAEHDYKPLIAQYAKCKQTNEWPGYPRPSSGMTELSLPDYAWR